MKKFWVSALAVLLAIGLSIPAVAATFKIGDADFKLSGSIRVNAAYQFTDKGDIKVGTEDSETDFFIKNPGNSRGSVWAKYENVSGFIEYGVRDDSDSRDSLYARHVFLSYDMGEGNSFTVGQTWSLLGLHFANNEMNYSRSMFGFGNLYAGRVPVVRFTHKGDVTFNIELENTDTKDQPGFISNEMLPALAGNLIYKTGGLTLTPSFLVQQYELTSTADGIDDIDVLGYALCLDTVYKLDMVTIDAQVWYAQNGAIFADAFDAVRVAGGALSGFGAPVYDLATGDIEDINSYGGWLQFTVPVDKNAVSLGAGYQQSEIDDTVGTEDDWSRYGLFANYRVNLTPQFFVQPEVAYYNYGEDVDGVNEYGSDTFVGVHFRYNF